MGPFVPLRFWKGLSFGCLFSTVIWGFFIFLIVWGIGEGWFES